MSRILLGAPVPAEMIPHLRNETDGYAFHKQSNGQYNFIVPHSIEILAPFAGQITYLFPVDGLRRGQPLDEIYHAATHKVHQLRLESYEGLTAVFYHFTDSIPLGECVEQGQRVAYQGGHTIGSPPHFHLAIYQMRNGKDNPVNVDFIGLEGLL